MENHRGTLLAENRGLGLNKRAILFNSMKFFNYYGDNVTTNSSDDFFFILLLIIIYLTYNREFLTLYTTKLAHSLLEKFLIGKNYIQECYMDDSNTWETTNQWNRRISK